MDAALFADVLGHLWMWFRPRSGVSESRDKVGAIDVSARNLTNTRKLNVPVARLPGVRQPCGDIDEWANAIDTRGRQRHLDNAISNDGNGDFRCGSLTTKRQQQLETRQHTRITLRVVA